MRICSVMDCLYVDRAIYLCTEPFIMLDRRGGCTTYKVDMKYLRLIWHQDIHASLKSKGYDSETQKMVDIAESLTSHSKPKAGEEARI